MSTATPKKRRGRDTVPGFAALVAAARTAAGLSQPQLARLAGVSQNAVWQIESGGRAPSLLMASKLARALGLVAYLHDPASPVPAGHPAPAATPPAVVPATAAAVVPAEITPGRPRGRGRPKKIPD